MLWTEVGREFKCKTLDVFTSTRERLITEGSLIKAKNQGRYDKSYISLQRRTTSLV